MSDLPITKRVASSKGGRESTVRQTISGAALERTSRPKTTVVACCHGWSGKAPHLGFLYAAQTKAEGIAGSTRVQCLPFKASFTQFLDLMASEHLLAGFHFFSHSGFDGPIFADGQFTFQELDSLPRCNWWGDAVAVFYGCNAGNSAFLGEFARLQKVRTAGASGYTSFSRKKEIFVPITDPKEVPVYQDSYPGMENIIVRKYGYREENAVEFVVKRLMALPEWWENRNGDDPPTPMIWYDQKGRRADAP